MGAMCQWPVFSGWRLLVLLFVANLHSLHAEHEKDTDGEDIAVDSGSEENTTKIYVAPKVDGIHWAETFDGDVWSRWVASKQEKFTGKFQVAARKHEALVGDVGLLVPEEAKHYGAAVRFPPIEGKKEVPFVVQFEAKFQDGLTCGGSYIKLFNSEGKEAGEFADDTPYIIMFGPDRCGATDKVHFILRHRDPKRDHWEEKHFKDAPSVPHDQQTHLYGLVIRPDNSFDILIDGEKKKSGNLLTSMEPPINPPKEIDDPEDEKPSDWVDEARMDDPEATKPEDWDEDAPMQIIDPKAVKPSGWNEDAEKRIPDPKAKKPDDWDDDEDGDWEAPIIDNPACKVGCGKWEPPKISNPQYKGKWHAPKIDNPAYKGIWKAKQIDNPFYFLDETPYVLPQIDALGIDIWTMNKGLLFDNIVISADIESAAAFAEQSFKLRKELEDLQLPKPLKNEAGLLDALFSKPIALAVTLGVILITTIGCCFYNSGAPPAPTAADRRRLKQQKKESAEKPEAPAGGSAEPSAPATAPVEGGLGDISAEDS